MTDPLNNHLEASPEKVRSGPAPEVLVVNDLWTIHLPDDNPPVGPAFAMLGAFGSVDPTSGSWTSRYPNGRRPSRETIFHEELHRRLHYRFETLATAPHLECWRHRDLGAA